eukprot:1775534-Pyramimonas_sp.AAC.1
MMSSESPLGVITVRRDVWREAAFAKPEAEPSTSTTSLTFTPHCERVPTHPPPSPPSAVSQAPESTAKKAFDLNSTVD